MSAILKKLYSRYGLDIIILLLDMVKSFPVICFFTTIFSF